MNIAAERMTYVKGKLKHKEAYFLKVGNVFVGKVYGHEGQDARANAELLTRLWNDNAHKESLKVLNQGASNTPEYIQALRVWNTLTP